MEASFATKLVDQDLLDYDARAVDDFVDGDCKVHLNLSDGRNSYANFLCRRDR
jgi:hypothetical protein